MKTVKIINPYALQILDFDSNEKEKIAECAKNAVMWAENRLALENFNCAHMTVEIFKKYFGIHFSDEMGGKMENMTGLSTAVTENPHCRELAKNVDYICHECYAREYLEFKKEPEKAYIRNGRILQNAVIPVMFWPYIFSDLFRIESFGDCANATQATNYLNLAFKNSEENNTCIFTVFSKAMAFYAMAIKQTGKPENMIFVQSSPCLNKAVKPAFDFIDKVFTVYTKEYAALNNIKITCGGYKCIFCRACYKKTDSVQYVNELLKSDQTIVKGIVNSIIKLINEINTFSSAAAAAELNNDKKTANRENRKLVKRLEKFSAEYPDYVKYKDLLVA